MTRPVRNSYRSRWSPALLHRVGALPLCLLFFLFIFVLPMVLPALEVTPEGLFREMEKRTEQIQSIVVDLRLSAGGRGTYVTLSIQSPDKFSMDFLDQELRVVFDGERLWIYVGSLREVFFLDAGSGGGWVSDLLRDWINPKKIITNVTRSTLFTLFTIGMQSHTVSSATIGLESPIHFYTMRFKPKGSSVFKKLFNVGFYEMTFSTENYLPTEVKEYSPSGTLRGTLEVQRYLLNQQLPKERFIFIVPSDVKEVPMATVLTEKLEQGKDLVVERIGDFFRSLQKKLLDWGR